MSTPSKITIIFVPGGWHTPEVFDDVAKLLQQAGYQTDYVHLPSVGPKDLSTGLEEDVAEIRRHIVSAVDKGQDVLVMAHSYGAIPTQDAIKGLDKKTRLEHEKSGGVFRLFLCCSFVINEGFNVVDGLGGQHAPWYRFSDDGKLMTPITPEETFYNDVSEERAKAAVAQLKPHSTQISEGKVKWAAWKHVPTTYLYCTKDQAIPFFLQQMMIEHTADKAGIKFDTETFDSGHSPFLSMPEETSKAIRRAAGENF